MTKQKKTPRCDGFCWRVVRLRQVIPDAQPGCEIPNFPKVPPPHEYICNCLTPHTPPSAAQSLLAAAHRTWGVTYQPKTQSPAHCTPCWMPSPFFPFFFPAVAGRRCPLPLPITTGERIVLCIIRRQATPHCSKGWITSSLSDVRGEAEGPGFPLISQVQSHTPYIN